MSLARLTKPQEGTGLRLQESLKLALLDRYILLYPDKPNIAT